MPYEGIAYSDGDRELLGHLQSTDSCFSSHFDFVNTMRSVINHA